MDDAKNSHIGLIIRDLHLEIAQYITGLLSPYRLAPEQHLLMSLLLEQEGLSQNDIALQLRKDKASVARMLASLESKGYITKAVSDFDRRFVKVYVTPEGRKLAPIINEVGVKINDAIEKGLSMEEQQTLTALLMKVQSSVRKS
ncbi:MULTISPECIES: MarR family winged helix-turn-helix transcriptional regulator [unclassified Paenibacillus]|uniref:MarR family winged helix-turn-helix transcriptional regulator n=1 Tax=unclassified Paenibacillus TaxID=185978 RepID=UPI002F3FE13E